MGRQDERNEGQIMSDGEEETILWVALEDAKRTIQPSFSPELANAFKVECERDSESDSERQ